MSLPSPIERNPRLNRWIRLGENGTVIVSTGKVEIGQGIKTAIAMIAAEELDVSVERIRVQTADTGITPNEFVTAGSMSVEDSGSAVRVASATARQILIEAAAQDLDVDVDSLAVEDGLVTSTQSNGQTDYWTLHSDGFFEVDIINLPALKNPLSYHTVGTKVTRERLAQVEAAENSLHDLGLRQLRVRHHGSRARVEVSADELESAQARAPAIGAALARAGFEEFELAEYRAPGAPAV